MTTATDPVKTALQTYANSLKASYGAVGVAAWQEEQLKSPTKGLLEACAHLAPTVAKKSSTVLALPEAAVAGTGRPDMAVLLEGLVNGFLELKAPGKGADPTKLKGHDKKQWEKFKLLPNLIYTDGLEWRLYRWDGTKGVAELIGKPVKLGNYVKDGAAAVTDVEAQALSALVQTFFNWKVITPTSPEGLANLLAPLARLLRQEVADALAVKGSNVENVRDQWKKTLFPGANDEQFSDIYAQTVTYAMLLARLDGADVLNTGEAVTTLRKGHELLASALKILADEDLQAELGSGFVALRRVISGMSSKVFKSQEERLWLYFYEHFLAAYDRKLRNDYGVYYTPLQVIGAQVRLVDEVLRTRLGKRDGLAEEGVVVLDPAAGTGAYPLAVIEHALKTVEAYGPGMVVSTASQLAKSVHGFEILVGPYAVAHLRVSQAVKNKGGKLPKDGAHIYLTNTLESPNSTNPEGLAFQFKPLTEEHARAQKVKRETPVMVTLGNPPYDRHDAKDTTRGGWIRYGDTGKDGKFEDFLKPVREAGEGGHLKNLYNDYVYFWRWALWKTFENSGTEEDPQPVPRPGVVCFITAASYLRGPGFMGMRELMRRTFDELWILDLGGDGLGARRTPNVFNIQTPVCIALGVKKEREASDTSERRAHVRYARLDGTREEKLAALDKIRGLSDVSWKDTMSSWGDMFLPQGGGAYWTWPELIQVFPKRHSGLEFQRPWPIGETKALLEQRWETLLQTGPKQRAGYFKENRDRKISNSYPDLRDSKKRLSTISSLKKGDKNCGLIRYSFRSFDRQWAILDNRVGNFLRPELLEGYGDKQVYLTSMLTGVLGEGPALTASGYLLDRHYFRGSYSGKDVIPLYLDQAATTPNVTPGLLDVLSAHYGFPVSGEDLFAYAYALLATPAYVEAHAEDLTVPGPRLPLTKDGALFQRGAKLGRELLSLHTYGERFTAAGTVGPYRGKAQNTKAIPSTKAGYPEEFSYDSTTNTLKFGEGEFSPVSNAVYEYSVSGLQVLQSWLKYRRKSGYGRKSSPLDDIRPEVWTADMTKELMELIWLLERTLELEPEHTKLLREVEAGECFTAEELPKPKKTDEDDDGENLDAEEGAEGNMPTLGL